MIIGSNIIIIAMAIIKQTKNAIMSEMLFICRIWHINFSLSSIFYKGFMYSDNILGLYV
jgi:hypothetical protein